MAMIQKIRTMQWIWVMFVIALFLPTVVSALEAPPASQISAEKQKLYDLFEKKMTNVKFTGNFTVLGKQQDNLPKESYTIVSVKKLAEGELWLFTARVQFGGRDVTLPMPLQVQWAGTTPVITLTNVLIPGLGTFSSRVVIYKNKYAGTWTHGDVGGHLFGTIGPNTDANPATDSPSKK
jgi:hypothetical protein|tara:strand:- start:1530 stop:2066 length:537 start_codon:yes stop_codon:yes gene_type:complete